MQGGFNQVFNYSKSIVLITDKPMLLEIQKKDFERSSFLRYNI